MAASDAGVWRTAPRARARLGAYALKLGRRWLYVVHRWIGIFTCLLCAIWFVSGVIMMYVPFPGLSDRDRMEWSAPVDLSAVRIAPAAALKAARLRAVPDGFKLNMQAGEPVYRFTEGKRRVSISALDGRRLRPSDAAAAVLWVRALHPGAPDIRAQTIERDQWTVAQGFDAHRPLHRVSLGDPAGTVVYVSSRTGEVVDDTTRTERFWNWMGAVPHWIYFTALRRDGATWRQVILWTSGPTLIGAMLGVWVGLLRLRTRRRYKGGRVSPYRGWMKWHHVGGLLAGLFVCTWLFSGWLSVNPFRWFDRTPASRAGTLAYLGTRGGPAAFASDPAALARLPAGWGREARFTSLGGRPLVVLMAPDLSERVFDGRSGAELRLGTADIRAAAAGLVPGAHLLSLTRLTQEDAYWYSHHTRRRLPVLRAVYDDADATWAHIDPVTGEILGRANNSSRTYRWLFDALHDMDLRWLLAHRPAWDLLVIGLSLGGLVISVSGIVIGWRRLGRKLASID